jgi:hypothetical protein
MALDADFDPAELLLRHTLRIDDTDFVNMKLVDLLAEKVLPNKSRTMKKVLEDISPGTSIMTSGPTVIRTIGKTIYVDVSESISLHVIIHNL